VCLQKLVHQAMPDVVIFDIIFTTNDSRDHWNTGGGEKNSLMQKKRAEVV